MSETVQEAVLTILAKYLPIKPEEVTLDTSLMSIGMDSLDAVEILFALEDRFDITIPNPSSISGETFGSIVRLVESLVEQKQPTP
ncbi:MAG: acyl carrier protein [Magnetococcus sp. MYC-9]